MASEPGGVASKLGGLYERQYAAEQILRLARGRLRRVRWEVVTTEAGGADVECEDADGTVDKVQLKRQNGDGGKWTIAALDSEGVLSAAADWLDKHPANSFTFVSSDPALQIKDICDQLRRYDGEASLFFKERAGASQERAHSCRDLLSRWRLDAGDSEQAERALSRLKRMRFVTDDRGRDKEERLLDEAELTFGGDRRDVVDRLATFLEDRLTQNVFLNDVIAYMAERGSRLRDPGGDPTLPVALHRLREEFARRLSAQLAGGVFLERPEVAQIVSEINSSTPPALIIVHGAPGSGKSGVLLGVFNELSSRTPILPISLTSHPPEANLVEYGRSLGLGVTPAVALRAAAGDRRAVMMVDQLDALRMTSAASQTMWLRGQEILSHALANRQILIVACRTFDLENDPLIRKWKEQVSAVSANSVVEFKIGTLNRTQVESLLKDKGADFGALSPRLQKLICQPILLDLWLRLAARGQAKQDSVNETGLLSDLISTLRQEAVRERNIPEKDVNSLLSTVRQYMEDHGASSMPVARLEPQDLARRAVCAVGLLVEDGKTVRFPHQIYLDHLVAKNVYLQAGGSPASVAAWLKQDQSLSRREQLRQLLVMLHDESPQDAAKVMESILLDDRVRFHLKQVTLGVLRNVERVGREQAELVARLAAKSDWREHVRMRLLWSGPHWFDAFNELGLWAQCLKTNVPFERHEALRLLGSVVVARPREVDALLELIQSDPTAIGDIEEVVPFDPCNDSPFLARFREQAVRNGKWTVKDLYLDRLAEHDPHRSVVLLEATIRSQLRAWLIGGRGAGGELLREAFLERHVRSAVRIAAASAWPRFFRLVRLLQRLKTAYRRQTRAGNSEYYGRMSAVDNAAELVVDLAGEAIAGIADKDLQSFARIIESYSGTSEKLVGAALLRGLARSPSTAATLAITWMSENEQQLATRIGYERDRHSLALDVIRAHSGACSVTAISAIERRLMTYFPEAEKDQYRYLLGEFRWGHWWYGRGKNRKPSINPCGRAQHLLLGAVPRERLSQQGLERLALWNAKFGGPAVEQFMIVELSSRGSPIPEDRASAIPDRHWYRLVNWDWTPWIKRQAADERTEYDHQAVSATFELAAKKDPPRFIALAAYFPDGAEAIYLARLWSVIADNATNISDVRMDDLHALLKKTLDVADGYAMRQACWAIAKHSNLGWGEEAWKVLEAAGKDPDPDTGKYAVSSIRPEGDQPDLESSGINCVRGVVAHCLAALLFQRPDRLARLTPLIEHLLRDPHVAVRMQAADLINAVGSIDVKRTLSLLFTLVNHPDDRLFAGHAFNRVLQYARWNHSGELGGIFARMARSAIPKVARRGARWVGAEYMQMGHQPELYRECILGSVEQRIGIAQVLCQLVGDERSNESVVRSALAEMFNDPDERVRSASANLFSGEEFIKAKGAPELAAQLAQSHALLSGAERFLHSLDEHCADVFQYRESILAAAERFGGDLAAASRDFSRRLGLTGRELASLLLRLYDRAQKEGDSQLAGQCLDAWDLMIRNRVGDIEGRLEEYGA